MVNKPVKPEDELPASAPESEPAKDEPRELLVAKFSVPASALAEFRERLAKPPCGALTLSIEIEPPAGRPSPAAVKPARPITAMQLINDGCQAFSRGELEEALSRFQGVLATRPDPVTAGLLTQAIGTIGAFFKGSDKPQ